MLGLLPPRRRAVMWIVVAGVLALPAVLPVAARAEIPQAPAALPQIWGVVVDGRTIDVLDRRLLRRMRAARVTLVADRRSLTDAQEARLARIRERSKLPTIAPVAAPSAAAAIAACRERKRLRAGRRCAVLAGRAIGGRLAAGRWIDLVAVPARLRGFSRLGANRRWGRVLGVVGVSTRGYRPARWRRAIRAAGRSAGLDLAIRPRGPRIGRALARVLRQLERQAGGDRVPPPAPRAPESAPVTQSSAEVSWSAPRSTAAFGLYRDGAYDGRSRRSSARVGRLTCSGHLIEIDAVDRAGNRSAKRFLRAFPRGCGGGGTVFVSASGSDAGRCTQAAPCASFDRAFRAARPGEVVEVAGGSYPPQVLTADGRTSGPNVVFRPASGARVRLAGLDFGSGGEAAHGPDFITVRRMETTYKATEPGAGNQEGVFVGPGSTHIELESMDVGSVSTWLAEHVTVRGGDIGPCQPTPNAPLVCNNNHIDASKHVLFSGVDIHDYRFDESCWADGADCHWECMYINGGENVTITRSTFRGCAIFDIFTTIHGDDAARMGHRNLRIVNNWFAAPWHETATGASERSTAVSVAWCQNSPHGYQDLFIGFNSFQRNANVMVDQNPACVFDDVRIVGNLMMYDACQSRWTWAYNVFSTAWRTGKCSSTDRIAGSQFPYVRGSGDADMDYHLAGPSVADDLVPVSQGCPAVDFDGQSRPVSGSCDAGADER